MTQTRPPIPPAAAEEFLISRVLDASPAQVYAAWTQPERLARWWGPESFTTPVCELDLRVGGAYRIVMRSVEGEDYPMTGVFQELAPPDRLVMTLDCAEHPPDWHRMLQDFLGTERANPAGQMVQTVTFEAQDGQTRLTIRTRFVAAAIREGMVQMGMHDGWSASLDRLERLLAAL